MTGGIGNTVCDDMSRRTMRDFLAQKCMVKRTTSVLVDWEAVDKMMDNCPKQFYVWVTNNFSKYLWDK